MTDRELYRQMLRIRRTEEKLLQLHSQGLLNGTTHTSIGQESIAVGLCSQLDSRDSVFRRTAATATILAAGGDLAAFLAELMGREGGVSGGRGGSQHLHAAGFISSGIQGQMVPVALGVALAKKLRGEDGIAVVFIGDGTLGEGALYESMNIASLWGVRLLIVLEDNQIAQTTPSSVAVAGDMLARAEAFGIDTARLEGADAPALEQELGALVETMRGQAAPVFRVIGTVRLGPHSKRDDERSAEEMEELRRARPGRPARARRSPTPRRSTREVAAELEAALAQAEASPEPDQLSHLGDVWAPFDEAAAATPWARQVEEPRVVEELNAAHHDLFERDQDVRIFGQDLLDPYGGAFAVTKGLSSRFADRVVPMPISEAAIIGSATGYALEGGKALAEIMFGDFVALAADQLTNSAAKHHYISRGESPVNLTVRVPMGGGRGYGPTHSQSLEKMFFGIPGLRVVAVSSFTDPYALLWNAVAADPGPVLFVENKTVYGERVRRPVDGLVEHYTARQSGGHLPERAPLARRRRSRPDRDRLRPLRDARVGARAAALPRARDRRRPLRRHAALAARPRRDPPDGAPLRMRRHRRGGSRRGRVRRRGGSAARRGRVPGPLRADRRRGVADSRRQEPRGRRAAHRAVDPPGARAPRGREGRAHPS